MTIKIKRKITPFDYKIEYFDSIIDKLAEEGFNPLISKAEKRFFETFGVEESDLKTRKMRDLEIDFIYRSYSLFRYYKESLNPIIGDLYYTPNEHGFLYILVNKEEEERKGDSKDEKGKYFLEVGCLKVDESPDQLENLLNSLNIILNDLDLTFAWEELQTVNQKFEGLSNSEETRFIPSNNISEDDLELSIYLENPSIRHLALLIKRSGGILATDLEKKAGREVEEVQEIIKELTKVNLLSQEYVVICNKTSNQINRVQSKDSIEKMTQMGVLCSCGNPISEERIETLFSPTDDLKRMLDHSYWMTAKLVRVLIELGIPRDKILLNLLEGTEEIDAFIDLEGTLLMFELKDNEFSMGHAYPFGGRIGLYKPDYAIIVSTKKIAPEVQEYFARVKPGAEIIYVENLEELNPKLNQILEIITTKIAIKVISKFDNFGIRQPISDLLLLRADINPKTYEKISKEIRRGFL
ncbi:MAG: hypothetical protein ACFFB5_15030 [Promethearchaeota archaeon]